MGVNYIYFLGLFKLSVQYVTHSMSINIRFMDKEEYVYKHEAA